MSENKEHKSASVFEKLKKFIVGEKSLVATLILIIVVVGSLLAAYFGCYRIAVDRANGQLDDAVNTVIDQINSRFERDSDVLNAVAGILADTGVFDGETVEPEHVKRVLKRIEPLQQTMNLRVLLPDDTIIMPDNTEAPMVSFQFAEEKEHGEHISHRTESQREGNEGKQLIAHFVPIYHKPISDVNEPVPQDEEIPPIEAADNEIVAMLYGVTPLESMSQILRTSNIYNSYADVAIVDVSSEGHDLIMDTMRSLDENGNPIPDFKLGSFDDFTNNIRGETSAEFREKVFSLQSGTVMMQSRSTGDWVYIAYRPASGIVSKTWSIFIAIPESVAFGNVRSVQTVFIIVGVVVAAALIAYFIWVRKKAQEAINRSVERAVLEERLHKAEAAERAKTTFLSNMSHDIRTPMNAILGFTALAETNLDDRDRVQDYLRKIMSSGNHLLSLINDILDMSRIESGKLNIEEKPCSISDIFRDMRNIIQTQMKTKQLNFFMDTLDVVDEDIYCDKLHMNQVLLNLLSNAIKFTPAGGNVALSIKQKAGAPTGYGSYEIRVKDTGIGMSKEFAKHIFEPFERERTSTVSGIQGTGLGMPIAKNIVEAMGGTIEVETEQGKGTEFIINLQFRLQSERKHVEAVKELEGMRALVVDDNFTTCDSVSKMLTQIGMRSEWTLYGKEAVLRAHQALDVGDAFGVYIIDWVMPDLSGFEIVRQIRKMVGENVPIIVVTAYDVSAIIDEAKEIGVTTYCNKPIFMSELRDTLISVVSKQGGEEVAVEDAPSKYEGLKGKKLLLVEDNELNREIAEEILTENGFVVDAVEDGTYAVEKMKNAAPGDYDLILMDVQMPIMDGYEATKAIRALPGEVSHVPIVAMTANAFDEDRRKAAESGMDAHVPKPIDVNQLLEVLNMLLSK